MHNRRNTFKNAVSVIVKDAIDNYLTYNTKEEEKEFINWLSERKFYYINKFTNTIVNNPAYNYMTPTQIVGLVASEVDKLQTEGVHKQLEPKESLCSLPKGENNEQSH